MRRSHNALDPEVNLAGRVRVDVEPGGKRRARRKGQPQFIQESWAQPAVRLSMDLFADANPARLGKTAVHEFSHVWLHAMQTLEPDRYDRLAAEVADIYRRGFAEDSNALLGDLKDPVRIGELFAKLLENHTLYTDTFRGGETFIETMELKFRKFVAGLMEMVKGWRERYWNVLDDNGVPTGSYRDRVAQQQVFPRLWSDELQQVADAYARGDWSEIADGLAATGMRATDGSGDTWSTLPKVFYDRGDDVGRKAGPAPKARPLPKPMEFKGLGRIPVEPGVRENFVRAARKINYDAVADALLNKANLGDGRTVYDAVRQKALWYEGSNAAGPQIRDEVVKVLDELAPELANEVREMDPRIVMNMLGAFGASRSPDQNLRLAVQSILYNLRVHGGNSPRLYARGEAVRGFIVSRHGEFAKAPARAVLAARAEFGEVEPAQILAKGRAHPLYPMEGESFVDWARRNPDGSQKLPNYNLGLLLEDGGWAMAHDIWDQRFFLRDRVESLNGLYRLRRGDVDAYRARVEEMKVKQREMAAEGRRLDKNVKELQVQLASRGLTKAQRLDLEAQIDNVRRAQQASNTKGVRILSADGTKLTPYKATAAEHRLMDAVEMRLGEVLNARDGGDFWHGKRVQAAIWAAMRGTLLDEKAGHFGDALVDSLEVNAKTGESFMRGWVKDALAAIDEDAGDVFVRSSNELVTPTGRNHPINKLARALKERVDTGKGTEGAKAEQLAKVTHMAVTNNGQYTLGVAKALGLKGHKAHPAAGMLGGDAAMASEFAVQGSADGVKRMGRMTAALNAQRSLEGADIRAVSELTEEGLEDAAGLILEYPGVGSLRDAEAAFQSFRKALSRRAGVPENQLISAGTTTSAGGRSITRITSDGGIVDVDGVLGNIADVADTLDVDVSLWRGESFREDVIDDIESGQLGPQWKTAWGEAGGAAAGVGAGADALPHGAGEAADVISAAWLRAAIEGAPEDTRRALLRQYLVTARGRFRLLAGLAEDTDAKIRDAGTALRREQRKKNPNPKTIAKLESQLAALTQSVDAGSTVSLQDFRAYRPVADGSVVRLLSELEPELVPASMASDVVAEAKKLRNVSFKALKAPSARSGIAAAVNPKAVAKSVQATARAAGVDQGRLPAEFYNIVDPEEMAKQAELIAELSADRFGAEGDTVTEEVRRNTAREARAAQHVARQAPANTSPIEIDEALQATGGGSREVVSGFISTRRHIWRSLFLNRFEGTNSIDRELSNAMNLMASSEVEADLFAARVVQPIVDMLEEPELALFERFLHHQKAQVALTRAGAGNEELVSPHLRELMLSPVEMAQVESNANIQRALELHRTQVQPKLESLLLAIDPTNRERLMQTESGDFISSLRYNPDLHKESVRRVPVSGSETSSLPSKFNIPQNSSSMRKFRGSAEEYVTDYREIIRWRMARDHQLYRQRQVLTLLDQKGLMAPTRDASGASLPMPPKFEMNGREIGWKRIRTADTPQWVKIADGVDPEGDAVMRNVRMPKQEYWVPEPIGKDWERFFRDSNSLTKDTRRNIAFQMADRVTGFTLATPVEGTRHSLRVLSLLASVPMAGVDASEAAARFLLPFVGVRAKRLVDIMAAYDGPDALDLERLLSATGSLPNRAFDETHHTNDFLSPVVRKLEGRGPRLKAFDGERLSDVALSLPHRGRGFLFDLPETDAANLKELIGLAVTNPRKAAGEIKLGPLFPVPKSLWGFDVRARMVGARMFVEHLKVSGRIPEGMTIAEMADNVQPWYDEMREFMTAFGQFQSGTQTEMVRFLKRWRLNPFASAQAGTRPAELTRLLGWSRVPMKGVPPTMRAWYRMQTIAGTWLGYMAALSIANKALSGHWPWENQNGREFDLDTGVKDLDGAPVYVKGTLLAPATTRALRVTGIPGLLDARKGETVGRRAMTQGVNLLNEGLSLVAGGPPVQAAMIAGTGRTPFLTQSGGDVSLLRVTEPRGPAMQQLQQRVGAVLGNMNSNTRGFFEDYMMTRRHAMDPDLKKALMVPQFFFGEVATIGKGRYPVDVEAGTVARVRRKEQADLAFFFLSEYQQQTTREGKNKVMQDYLRNFPEGPRRQKALYEFWNTYVKMIRGGQRRAAESAAIEGGLQ